MPTAANLISALSLAVLAYVVTGQIIPLFPEGKDFGSFWLVNVCLGLAVGWVVMGKRAGRGLTPAINNGFTSMVVLVFWGLFVQGCVEMTRLAMRNRYDGPFEAILAIFEIGFDYLTIIATPTIIGTLVVGGVISGLLAEFAARRWR